MEQGLDPWAEERKHRTGLDAVTAAEGGRDFGGC
jgi:hypothetical protein